MTDSESDRGDFNGIFQTTNGSPSLELHKE